MTNMKYYCKQCDITNEQACCRGCHQFLSVNHSIINGLLKDAPLPIRHFEWMVSFAHFGDSLACCSIAKDTLDRIGKANTKMLYIGRAPEVVDLMLAQDWITEVKHYYPENYNQIYETASCHDVEPKAWLSMIPEETPAPSTVWQTQLHQHFSRNYRCVPLKELNLPARVENEANKFWEKGKFSKDDTFMLHPTSTWSYPASGHWPYWKEAISYLLENTDYRYIMTGLEPVDIKHPRLINLIGKTESYLEVLALSKKCKGVLSTCNSLGLTNTIWNKPGLICGNGAIMSHANYFRRYIDQAPNAYIDVDDPLEKWVDVASEWLKDPELYVQKLLAKQEEEKSEARLQMATETAAKPIPPKYFKVTQGIVSGKKRDFRLGEVAADHEINGDPLLYVNAGMLKIATRQYEGAA